MAGVDELTQAVRSGSSAVLDQLLRSGASTGARNAAGNTALHTAASDGRLDAAKVLLRHGADANTRNNLGNTPLHVAAAHNDGELVALLLQHGADANITNDQGQTPRMLAESSGPPTDAADGRSPRRNAAALCKKHEGRRRAEQAPAALPGGARGAQPGRSHGANAAEAGGLGRSLRSLFSRSSGARSRGDAPAEPSATAPVPQGTSAPAALPSVVLEVPREVASDSYRQRAQAALADGTFSPGLLGTDGAYREQKLAQVRELAALAIAACRAKGRPEWADDVEGLCSSFSLYIRALTLVEKGTIDFGEAKIQVLMLALVGFVALRSAVTVLGLGQVGPKATEQDALAGVRTARETTDELLGKMGGPAVIAVLLQQ